MTNQPVLVSKGVAVCDMATARGLAVRLLGGTAIWLRSPDSIRAVLTREFADLDLVTLRRDAKALRDLLEELEYVPDKVFNATQGTRRLYFTAPDRTFHIDVFVEKFVMSHELDLGARLEVDELVLPAAELLLTKLQIAELNRKDAADTIMLLLGHELTGQDAPGQINADHVAAICAQDWGLYTTVTDNLAKTNDLTAEILASAALRSTARARIEQLLRLLDDAPKTGAWRRRARIGRRLRWYQTPDEV